MSMRILNTAAIYDDKGARAMLADAGFELFDSPPRAPFGEEDIIDLLEDVDAVIADSDAYTDRVFAERPRLKLVSRWGVGIDSIDLAAATRHGVMVTNTPGIITDAVADLAFTFILGLARRLVECDSLVRGGGWQKMIGANVGGATLGIIGVGDIGTCSARRGKGFGMRVLAFDPVPRQEVAAQLGVEFVDLETLLRESDFVTLHCNATPENRNMIGAEQLAMMKPTAFLINCARGSLVDETALVDALRAGPSPARARRVRPGAARSRQPAVRAGQLPGHPAHRNHGPQDHPAGEPAGDSQHAGCPAGAKAKVPVQPGSLGGLSTGGGNSAAGPVMDWVTPAAHGLPATGWSVAPLQNSRGSGTSTALLP